MFLAPELQPENLAPFRAVALLTRMETQTTRAATRWAVNHDGAACVVLIYQPKDRRRVELRVLDPAALLDVFSPGITAQCDALLKGALWLVVAVSPREISYTRATFEPR